MFLFVKQKTAYEMRISDWSSDVCSSDLEITSVVHIHTPWLGGWAQTHRTLPIRYAASQGLTLSREIPPHIDRSRSAGDFILERLEHDPDLVAILDRKSVVEGKSVSVRVNLGGRRVFKKHRNTTTK